MDCASCAAGSLSGAAGASRCPPGDFGISSSVDFGWRQPVPRVRKLQLKSELVGGRLECVPRRPLGLPTPLVSAIVAPEREPDARTFAADGAKEEAPSASANDQEVDDVKFDWNSQWYPVFVAAHLDKRLPHIATVLSRDFVVWWDRNGGSWQIFEDRCPHRLAPLSEGRINEDGHLQCSYHGWAFAPSTGACSLIPQAPADRPTLKDSKRACATVYPSTVHQGLLWVWPDASEGAEERATANPPPTSPELDDPDFVYRFLSADLGYGYEALTENLLDPAHVPFAHHKIQALRSQGRPLDLKVRGIKPTGFVGESAARGPVGFQAPCLVTLRSSLPSRPTKPSRLGRLKRLVFGKGAIVETKVEKQRRVALTFYCIPVAPGKSRLIAAIPRNFAKLLFYLTPLWVTHQNMVLLLSSDLYFLNIMERTIEQLGGNKAWLRACYVPTGADACVIAFRRWLQQFSGGTVDWGGKDGTLPPTLPKTQLLDRYSMHMEKCPSCSQALAVFKVAETGLLLLSFALVALLAASGSVSRVRSSSVPLAVLAVACFAISRLLTWYIRRAFYFRDYIHGLVK